MLTCFEYFIISIYITAIISIGIYLSRKGSKNPNAYFLGGKSLPWWMLGISFMTSNLDLAGTMVISSFFAMVGMKGFLIELRGGTCLPLAFFMVFMAKWHNRARVMTVAEWMEIRFGHDQGAKLARIVSAISIVILVIGMLTFFCVGFGKFLDHFFNWGQTTCIIVFTSIATLHIVFAGLYGVVFTDVLQGGMILFAVVYTAVLAFSQGVEPITFQEAWATLGMPDMVWEKWSSISPSWKVDFPGNYAMYNMFGFMLVFWLMRVALEGFGGPLIPYASQRFFAAKNGREASLTTGSSLLFFTIRWPLIIGIALLALGLGFDIPTDPELVFPAVIGKYFPHGLRAVVVAAMIAAAMSTFDSTINAGGAYIVNDIYHRFINPKASNRKLVSLSWVSTVGLVVICITFAYFISSINQIWAWISMCLFGGMSVPFVLRWYWERFNGWGFAIGTLVGITTALVMFIWPEGTHILRHFIWAKCPQEAFQLAMTFVCSLAASVCATYATQPTDIETTKDFYRRTQPIGHWPRAREGMAKNILQAIKKENSRDFVSILPALAFFYSLFLCPMYVVTHNWSMAFVTLGVIVTCGIILYFSWYRYLGKK